MEQIQVYKYREDLERRKQRIRDSTKIVPANKELIFKFLADKSADRNISIGRIRKLALMLEYLAPLFEKDMRRCDMDDIKGIVSIINNEPRKYLVCRKTASEAYKCDLRATLKMFIRFVYGERFDEKKFKWFVTSIKRNKIKSRVQTGENLTVEEVELMIKATNNTRDKALISVAYETAARPSELLTLRVGSVVFDEYGAIVHIIDSKTTPRPIRIIKAAPYLRAWVNIHPLKDESEAPLWLAYQSNPLNYNRKHDDASVLSEHALCLDSLRKVYRITARKAGVKKRIYPYLFRHSRITHLVQTNLSETVIKRITGHTQDSESFEFYIHLSNKDVDEAYLKHAGLLVEHTGKKLDLTQSIICFNSSCRKPNPPTAKVCEYCNAPIDMFAAAELFEKARDAVTHKDVYHEIATSKSMDEVIAMVRKQQAEINALKRKLAGA